MSRLYLLSVILALAGQSLANRTRTPGQHARPMGARLVVVKSAAMDAYLGDTIKNSHNDNTWIGLDDINSPTHQFVWSDGSTLTSSDYSNWERSQPDNPDREQCVEIRVVFAYSWNNHLCGELKHYTCEKEGVLILASYYRCHIW
ncbi:CD209 antigen-like protein E [Branchiostoma floridae]|uniref:CD209 antigen-like protein E n=1 Tax=Branchiostoma floridae TaxID=7739 RepID=A0A9J7LPH9_BRAFL|nr:CD209 antigen-like protein E [Branchiostoma floridae]